MKRVALLIETSRSYGRDLLRGVKRYSTEHGPWSMFVEVRDLESQPPLWLTNWDGDGMLTRSGNAAIAEAVRRVGVPAVELRSTRRSGGFPFVGMDNQAIGGLVAEHLLNCGFRHFGVYALETEQFFIERRESFERYLKERSFTTSALMQTGLTERPKQWERQQTRLMEWIAALPKPAGMMACTDQLGCWLLDACSRVGVRVPEEIAVVGVENDETLTAMSTPPLSSVRLAGEEVGYEAARVLDGMMRGKPPERSRTLIPPRGIEIRQSSDFVAIDDPLLAKAIRVIRETACGGARVDDVLKRVPLSRSSLERGCRAVLGRSPNAELNRIRLQEVCRLLKETDLTLDQIAPRTGFQTSQYLLQLFKQTFGVTPGSYRRGVPSREKEARGAAAPPAGAGWN